MNFSSSLRRGYFINKKVMRRENKNFALYRYFEEAKKGGSDSWYKLLPMKRKKDCISDCISKFVIRAPKKDVIYFCQIMDFFHYKIQIKPSRKYVSEVFEKKFNINSTIIQCTVDNLYYERKQGYFGFVLKNDTNISYEIEMIKKKYI